MVRIFLAHISNDISSAYNDTTLFDRVWKTKGFVEQGFANTEIAMMLADSTKDLPGKPVGANSSSVSVMVQVCNVMFLLRVVHMLTVVSRSFGR